MRPRAKLSPPGSRYAVIRETPAEKMSMCDGSARSTQEALHRLRSAIDDAYDSIGVESRSYVPVMVPAGMPLDTIHT